MAQGDIYDFLLKKWNSKDENFYSINDLTEVFKINKRSIQKQVRRLYDYGLLDSRRINKHGIGYRIAVKNE